MNTFENAAQSDRERSKVAIQKFCNENGISIEVTDANELGQDDFVDRYLLNFRDISNYENFSEMWKGCCEHFNLGAIIYGWESDQPVEGP